MTYKTDVRTGCQMVPLSPYNSFHHYYLEFLWRKTLLHQLLLSGSLKYINTRKAEVLNKIVPSVMTQEGFIHFCGFAIFFYI